MSECEKRNCGYYYQLPDEDYPRCHWEDDGFRAPCEYDDDYEPEDIDDDFENTIKLCKRVTYEDWKKRPLKEKLIQAFLYFFKCHF